MRLEPSLPTNDATCPHCGQLLWLAARRRGIHPRWAAASLLGAMVLGLACLGGMTESWRHLGFLELLALAALSILLFGRSVVRLFGWLVRVMQSPNP